MTDTPDAAEAEATIGDEPQSLDEAEPFDSADPEPPDEAEPKYASKDDFSPGRDGNGDLLPQETTIPGVNGGEPRRVRLVPLNYGDMKARFGDGSLHDVDEDILARLFDQHVVEPDLAGLSGHARGRVTAKDIDELYPMDPRHLLEALFDVSGINADLMMSGAQGEVEFQGN